MSTDPPQTRWQDGMGRITIKCDTGAVPRSAVMTRAGTVLGVVRAPGWLQIYGPAHITIAPMSGDWLRENRERMAEKARYRRMQRHGPKALRSRGYGPGYHAVDADETIH